MNIFDLSAKITVDTKEYERGLTDAEKKAYSAGQKIGNGLQTIGGGVGKAVSAIGTIGSAAIKVGTTAVKGIGLAVAGASAAITPIVKQSVEAYGEQEQLIGGIQKLYGNMGKSVEEYAKDNHVSVSEAIKDWTVLEKAQNDMMYNAQNAFQTTGMSTNEYIQNVTGFSAALINSLKGNTVKAADVADMAMKDIADNANTFGKYTAQEIAGVYQSLAKGQYMTLDNLNLGYGGTKEGMQALIDKANELGKAQGKSANLQIDSYADIVEAIHRVQENMNITGTTEREAAKTIQGSIAMTKAAWQNLLAGLGGGEDISKLIDNLVSSAEMAFKNLLPVIENALTGIASFVEKIVPVIADKLPALVEQIIPPLLNAATDIVNALVAALPTLIKILGEQGPIIISTIVTGIMDNLQELLWAAGDVIEAFLNAMLDATNTDSGGVILQIIDMIIGTFGENYTNFFDIGMQIITNILNGIINDLPWLIDEISWIMEALGNALIDNLPLLITAAAQIITSLASGIAENLPTLLPMAVDVILTIVESLIDNVDQLIDAAIEIVIALAEGIINALPRLLEKAPVIIEKLVMALINNLPKLLEAAVQLVVKLVAGIIQNLPKIIQAGVEIIGALVKGIINTIGKLVETGVRIKDTIYNAIKGAINSASSWGRDLIDSFVSGIKNAIGKVSSAVSGVASTVKSYLHFSEPDVGPLSNFHTYAPDMMKLFAEGIADNTDVVTDQISKSFDFGNMITTSDMTGEVGVSTRTYNNAPVINIYGAEGQDVRELANIVADVINNQYERQALAWG